LGEGTVLGTIRRRPPATCLGASGGNGLARRRQRRNPAIGWIDDERRTFRPDDFRPPVVPRVVVRLRHVGLGRVGVNQLTRVMAVELAPARIRVNAVAPRYLENIMQGAIAEHADPVHEDRIRARTPLGRRARLDELIGPVVFLASDASSYVTGAILV